MALIKIIDKLFNQRKPVEVEGAISGDVALTDGDLILGRNAEIDGKVIVNSVEDIGYQEEKKGKNSLDIALILEKAIQGIFVIVTGATDFEEVGEGWTDITISAPFVPANVGDIGIVKDTYGQTTSVIYRKSADKAYQLNIESYPNSNLKFFNGVESTTIKGVLIEGIVGKVFTPFFTEEQYEALLALLENN